MRFLRPASFLVGHCAVLVVTATMGCRASTGAPTKSDVASTLPAGDDGGAASGTDGGAADERPFAGSTAEATALIAAVVDKKGEEIGRCVREFKGRNKLAGERVSVSFGIDMEGTLLGVTSKGKEDAELKRCVEEALKGASFPRSHAGVITVTKTYGELLQ